MQLKAYIGAKNCKRSMIHVCSLSRLHATVDETGAQHIVTLLRLVDRI